ncbi:SAV_2336 N-terminal domain-related protein [Streptomyces sp. SBR177]
MRRRPTRPPGRSCATPCGGICPRTPHHDRTRGLRRAHGPRVGGGGLARPGHRVRGGATGPGPLRWAPGRGPGGPGRGRGGRCFGRAGPAARRIPGLRPGLRPGAGRGHEPGPGPGRDRGPGRDPSPGPGPRRGGRRRPARRRCHRPGRPRRPAARSPRVSHTLSSGRGTVHGDELPGALRDPRALARALRPFNRRLPGGARRRVLDEEATAVRAAETGRWQPVLTRPPDRWFEVALVVERSVSMTVWQPVARAFAELLRLQGAFADVRLWSLDTRDGKHAVLRPADGGPGHSPAELFRPDGRRIVLLMSDCVGDAWAGGAVPRLLHTWGRRAPVAVLQPLPTHLWDLCDGVPMELRVRAAAPGLPNSRLELLRYGRWERPLDADPADPLPLPVPVLELEPDWFAGWSRMVTGGALPWTETTSLLVDEQGLTAHCLPPFTWEERRRPVPPDQAVRRFLQHASPAARRLAARLAMVPLRPEVVEAVRQAPASSGGPLPFAEILLGGLLALRTTGTPGRTGEEYVFEFLDGVRSGLAARARPDRTAAHPPGDLGARRAGRRGPARPAQHGDREPRGARRGHPDRPGPGTPRRRRARAQGPGSTLWCGLGPGSGASPFGPVTTGEEVRAERDPAPVPDAARVDDSTPPNAKDTTSMEAPPAGGTAADATPPAPRPRPLPLPRPRPTPPPSLSPPRAAAAATPTAGASASRTGAAGPAGAPEGLRPVSRARPAPYPCPIRTSPGASRNSASCTGSWGRAPGRPCCRTHCTASAGSARRNWP